MEKEKHFYIETFGCQMNEFDSERISYSLQENGYRYTSEIRKADVIIINTCSVRKRAENRLYGHIGNLKALKLEKPDLVICIGGCTAQDLKSRIIEDFPFVDIVFGTKNQGILPALIEKKIELKRSICETGEDYHTFEHIYDFDRKFKFKAFLPVMVGCNNFCSYCIVPYVRGPELSVAPELILKAVKELVKNGVIEIMLLGQNVNSYGNDLKDKSATGKKLLNFAELLNEVAQADGLKRIRFMTSHPKDFTEELIDVIEKNKNIMKHVHLPLQAGSDRVLDLMNRKYSRTFYIDLYGKIKDRMPECSITTDIIVGFPQEQYKDFLQTLEAVKMLRFNRVFTFIYSGRKGTAAERLKDTVSRDEKKIWFRNLVETQNDISLEENLKLVGRDFDVLVEGQSKRKGGLLEGRLENNSIVNFSGGPELTGTIKRVKITQAKSFYFNGELQGDEK
ncbi:MAG: tRNA (N6-isopentenyl adenosine(37)-C2)-methylthiotransferase MiaB [Actinobacteria bacterium]|nr:tRNA (N6-isopentenyl adenosine(37)-C2)-methylthiotransferase MiaB [Actinomycetota bacterium]